jgi:CoA:oxalate CoA-transferase
MIFKDIHVLDLTKVFSGPFATQMLAAYGAEVVKIETPENYDDAREFAPLINNHSGYFEILNHNKKSISLNLKDQKDKNKFYKLVEKADVIVENLTPQTKHKLAIDYITLQKINSKIIYASLSGVGQRANRKYYDIIAQAESGLMTLSGTPGNPVKIGPSVVDAFSGMTLAFAISSALYHRQKTGEGQYVDVTMLGCAMNLLEQNLIEYSINKQPPIPPGNQDTTIAPFGIYKTHDGHIALAIGNDIQWQQLKTLLEDPILQQDKFKTNSLRVTNNTELTTILENIFQRYTQKELGEWLSTANIPASQVETIVEVYNNKYLYNEGMLKQIQHAHLGNCVIPGTGIQFSKAPQISYEPSPEIGQNNKEYGI